MDRERYESDRGWLLHAAIYHREQGYGRDSIKRLQRRLATLRRWYCRASNAQDKSASCKESQ